MQNPPISSESTEDSINFFDIIREFVKQEEETITLKFGAVVQLYTEAFLTIQKIDEKRIAD